MLKELGFIGSAWPTLFYASRRSNYNSAWHGHVSFMHWLIAVVRPLVFVELGTEYGISFASACHSSAMNGAQTKCYAVDTWQGDAHTGKYDDTIFNDVAVFTAQYYSAFATLKRMRFDQAIKDFEDGSIDILHVDGLHTYSAVKEDFQTWLPKMSDKGVVLFHDTAVKAGDFGVWRLWEELSSKYPSFTFHHSFGLGVIATGKDIAPELDRLFSLDLETANAARQIFLKASEISRTLGQLEFANTTS